VTTGNVRQHLFPQPYHFARRRAALQLRACAYLGGQRITWAGADRTSSARAPDGVTQTTALTSIKRMGGWRAIDISYAGGRLAWGTWAAGADNASPPRTHISFIIALSAPSTSSSLFSGGQTFAPGATTLARLWYKISRGRWQLCLLPCPIPAPDSQTLPRTTQRLPVTHYALRFLPFLPLHHYTPCDDATFTWHRHTLAALTCLFLHDALATSRPSKRAAAWPATFLQHQRRAGLDGTSASCFSDTGNSARQATCLLKTSLCKFNEEERRGHYALNLRMSTSKTRLKINARMLLTRAALRIPSYFARCGVKPPLRRAVTATSSCSAFSLLACAISIRANDIAYEQFLSGMTLSLAR